MTILPSPTTINVIAINPDIDLGSTIIRMSLESEPEKIPEVSIINNMSKGYILNKPFKTLNVITRDRSEKAIISQSHKVFKYKDKRK